VCKRQHDRSRSRAPPGRDSVLIGYIAVPQRGQYSIVEGPGFFQVIGAQRDMGEHGYSILLIVVLQYSFRLPTPIDHRDSNWRLHDTPYPCALSPMACASLSRVRMALAR